jgi:hypothetical protein
MDVFQKSPGGYRIEVSGWGLDHSFFVESTDLHWALSGDKKLKLHRALAEGTVVFVRLLDPESSNHSVPVPYRVEGIEAMDRSGRCQMKLRQVNRRSKESLSQESASNELEEARRTSGQAQEQEDELLQTEEVL